MSLLLPMLFYLSAAVFLAGMGSRVVGWMRTPAPLKIPLTPGPTTRRGVARRLAGEVFLFLSLWRADRRLWAMAWFFHASMVLLAAGHLGGLVMPEFSRTLLGLTEPQFHHLAQVAGGLVGVAALVPLFYLLLRRFTAEPVRCISRFGDYLALVWLLLVVLTGNGMRFAGDFDMAQARQFVSGWLALHPAPPPANPFFTAHLLLVCGLLVYIPFSKLVHLGGLAFSPTLNQRNNPREERYV